MPSHDNVDEERKERSDELLEEVKRLRRENELFRREHKFGAFILTVITLGQDLSSAIEAWVRARRKGDDIPVEVTVGLVAALVRRGIRVGLVGLALAAVPIVLLAAQVVLLDRQNQLIGRQNTFFQEQTRELQSQTESLRQQNDQQIRESQLARRAQLIATIYDQEEPCSDPFGCPRANLRARIDAVRSFVEIERIQGRIPNLLVVDLRDAVIQNEDFSGVNFSGAKLQGAMLSSTDLSGCNLSGATLPMDLSWSNLAGADLNGAIIEHSVLGNAYGDDETRIPLGSERPKHWPTKEEATSYDEWLQQARKG